MKKKLFALLLAYSMMFSSIGIVYGEDAVEESPAQEETEVVTEAPTEDTTTTAAETTTEEPVTTTEPTTKAVVTEPATSSATTTTKSSPTYTDEKKDEKITVQKGEGLSLESYIKFTNLDVEAFDWYSNNEQLVSVNNKGYISASSNTGTATITAKATDGSVRYTVTFDITVSDDAVTTTKSISLYVDDDKDLYDYVDDYYSASHYTWESDNTKYVTVNSKGVITGEKEGSAQVTAIYDKNGKYLKYVFNVRVHDDDDDDSSNVRYSSSSNSSSSKSSSYSSAYIKTSWTFYLGTNDDIDVTGILEDDPEDYDWNVSDDTVVEVDEDDGIIEAIDEGTAKVTAKGDNNFTFNVKISDDYSVQEVSIRNGETLELRDYLSGDMDEYHFSSDREDVAEVDSSGDVEPVTNGVATILCERDGDEVVMFLVTVSGMTSKLTTSTTYESYTEATTSAAIVATAAQSFTDISHRAWAIESIKAMASKGIILGVGNNKFAPDKNCTRADFTIVLTKILGMGHILPSNNYADVAETDYFYSYVGAARMESIECGVNNDKFRPKDNITREEMMVMVYKGLVSIQGETMDKDTAILSKFTDASGIAEENKEAVAALVSSGAISGTSATTLEPKADITRAQMAVIMNKIDQMIN